MRSLRNRSRSSRRTCAGAILIGLAALTGTGAARAQEVPPLSRRKIAAQRLDAPPAIDGDLSDAAWKAAARADLFSDRYTQSRGIDQTEAWIGYDDTAIYVAFRCRDSQPDAIVAREIRRDAGLSDEDTVTVQIDPFHSRQGSDRSRFTTNALGTPSADIGGGRANKLEWKGEWDSAATRIADGWAAEMRIPWQILSLPVKSAPVTMGINFFRRQHRTKINSDWSNLGPEGFDERNGDWEGVRLPKELFRRALSLLPYVVTDYSLGGGRRTAFGLGRDRLFNLGLDARLALTPELTAIATLNPDFSTVESAVAGIDFTRGERFVADTRPFFLEGSDYFRANVSAGRYWGRSFFGGRIPAFDLGGKVYGRYGPRDSLGLLATTRFDTQRHDFVGRWAHDVGPSSTVGAYLVQRSLPGDSNTVFGVNESIRRGPWFLRTDLSHAMGNGAGGSAISSGVRWDHAPWELHLGYNRVDPGFNAKNGFVPFTDFHGPDASVYYYREWRDAPVRRFDLYALVNNHWRTDGKLFRRMYEVNVDVQLQNDWGLRGSWNGGRFLDERDNELRIGFTRNLTNRYDRAGIDYAFGTRADHPIQFIQPFISRRIFGKWDLAASTSLLSHTQNHSLHVVTLGRELDRYRAFGGRVVIEDGVPH